MYYNIKNKLNILMIFNSESVIIQIGGILLSEKDIAEKNFMALQDVFADVYRRYVT